MKHLYLSILVVFLFSVNAFAQVRASGEPVLIFEDPSLSLQRPIPAPGTGKIALTTPNFSSIWVMNSDGTNLRQVSDEVSAGFGMSWAADGNSILSRVVIREDGRRLHAVKVFDSESGESVQLTEYRNSMPVTPVFDGNQQQVILTVDGQTELLDAPVTRMGRMAEGSLRPTAIAQRNTITLSVPGNSSPQTISPLGTQEQYMNAVVSPDGSKLAFEVYGGNLHVLNLQTGNLTDFGVGYQASWSPDGNFLTFMRNQDDGYRLTSSEIVAATSDNSFQTVLVSGENDRMPVNPVWDTAQNRIYFDYYAIGAILYIEVVTE